MNEAEDKTAHTIVIRDVRSVPTARERKVSSKASLASASLAEDALLKAFPILHHETAQHHKARIEAFQSCWSGLSAHLKDVLEKATTSTFKELGAYAKAQQLEGVHAAFGKRRLVPTALAVAGSMNSADHAGTFSALVAYLREQGCHAGLLQHQDLGPNKGISIALNSIMRQFSGLNTEACDMEALQAWHADEVAKSNPLMAARQSTLPRAGSSARSPAKRRQPCQGRQLQSPTKRCQLDASVRTTRSRAAQESAAHASGDSSARGLVSDSEEDDIVVHLSDDDSSSSEEEPAAQPGPSQRVEVTTGEAALAVSCKPLVIVVENTENADLSTLQDLILVLSEVRAQLPVTLVLGMSISVGGLRHMLPVKAADVLQAKEFRLVQAKTLLECLVGEVLLGQRFHGLLFHHHLLDALLHHFLSHDFSMTCIRQGLQVACLRHFQSEPLSALVPAAAEGPEALAQAWERLPPALRNSITGSGARHGVGKVVAAWRSWAVSVRWLHEAAQALGMGHSAASDGFSLTSLYVDTSDPAYMAPHGIGHKRLHSLCAKLEELSDDRCRQLLQALLRSCELVAGGAQAVTEDRAGMKSLLEEAEAFQGDSSAAAATLQQQQQQQGHSGSLSALPVTPAPAHRQSGSLASMLKKQKAPLSGVQRQQELLGAYTKGKEVAFTPEARGLGMRHQQKPRLAVRFAGLIQKTISSNLAKPPTSLAGAKALCCSAYAEVKDMMSSAPRWAVHRALAERTPANYAARQAPAQQLGIAPDMEDAAIAYRLLLEYGESVGVADWFQSVCAVHRTRAGPAEADKATPSSISLRRRGKKQQQHSGSQTTITKYMPGKRRGQQTLSPILEHAAEEGIEGSTATQKKTRGKGSNSTASRGKAEAGRPEEAVSEVPEAAEEAPADRVALQDLAVRFSCASRELQFLGLIKESSRSRKDGTVQRLAYPMRLQAA